MSLVMLLQRDTKMLSRLLSKIQVLMVLQFQLHHKLKHNQKKLLDYVLNYNKNTRIRSSLLPSWVVLVWLNQVRSYKKVKSVITTSQNQLLKLSRLSVIMLRSEQAHMLRVNQLITANSLKKRLLRLKRSSKTLRLKAEKF